MNTEAGNRITLSPLLRRLTAAIVMLAAFVIFAAAYRLIPLPVQTDCTLLFCGNQAWQLKGMGLIFLVVAFLVAITPGIKRIHAVLLVVAVVFMLASVFVGG
jgi:hypothetical protein